MNTSQTRRRRIASLLIIACALAVGASTGVRLAAYGVPFALLTACVLGIASSSLWLYSHIDAALTSTTHRCRAPYCTVQVRMRHVSAADSLRWQEIAAAHPTHDTR
ncbi:hypothetical protein O1Q96_37550 [Streptomyces sp. Qhu-G9]|uniref:hypothetical protein n=1 Tax=Streptomyces sp. Qhu-G9 TaxID=3452799 RepID=UPI0022AC7206|nr:hypothetical protein [Streptomyces aurantiacus]WAU84900.1 hypothetical protein O1Q96_37550 [Streptomyces aurantiacus]